MKFSKKILASILAISLIFIAPGIKANAVTTASGSIAKGIDVSKHNGAINWAQVKASGVSFAFIKIGSTYSGVDPMFNYNIQAAQANGIKTGVYIYSYAKNVEQAKTEAMLVLEWLAPYGLQLPVVFDIEDKSLAGVPNSEINAMINAFCTIIDEAGYYPMVYSYKNFYNGRIGMTPWDKWAAQYSSQLDMGGAVSFWQYTSSGSVPGINGRVDMNYQYKDYSNLIICDGFLAHNGAIRLYKGYKMQRGWTDFAGARYHLDQAGNLNTGLFTDVDGKIYYLDVNTGAMTIGPANVGGVNLYFGPDGVKQTGFITYGAGTKYYDPALDGALIMNNFITLPTGVYYAGMDGTLYVGLQTINGNQYYFNEAAIMTTGLVTVGNQMLYFGADGIKQVGFIDYGQGLRYFDPATGGAMAINTFFVANNATYFAGANGALTTGLTAIGDKMYYFDEATGIMAVGLVGIKNQIYFFGADGSMQLGLVDIGQGVRYFDPEMGGAMAVNRQVIINGKLFMAGEDGTLVEVPATALPDAPAIVPGTPVTP